METENSYYITGKNVRIGSIKKLRRETEISNFHCLEFGKL
jgi:hypothetical protein